MTYPQLTVRGENLPEPFEGWGDEEYSTDNRAVYIPSRFEWIDDKPLLYLVWESPEREEQMWIHTDNISSVKVTHDHDND